MNDDEAAGGSPDPRAEDASLDALLCSLAEQLSVVMSNTEKVQKLCSALKLRQSSPPCQANADALLPLLPTLAQRTDPSIIPLFDLLKHTALAVKDPWPLLKGMLLARDADLVVRSLQIAHQRAAKGDAEVDRETVSFLARQAQIPGSPLASDDVLPSLRDIVSSLRTQAGAIGEDPVLGLFCRDPDPNIRALAARILDLAGEPVSQRLAARMLNKETFDFLSPYLVYTLATHLDLLALLEPLRRAPVAADLQRARALVGDLEFRRIIKYIGWPRLNLSLDVCPCVLVARGQSIPLVLRPEEVPLAKRCGDVQVTASVTVATAHGGMSSNQMSARGAPHTASQFREYNLRHAEVLGEFLTLAPLTKERALKILGTMDLIVRDFEGLFATLTNECSILPDVYGSLKAKILAELDASTSKDHMSLEMTRLVMMFEEPASMGQVQTLHGLKRYLHQKGLQLGFKLMQGGPSTNRTVDILLVSGERILQHIQAIRYSDFEPEQSDLQIPYAVRIVADGFARQALFGHNSFPRVDIFCYGNEVQYFLQFKNHPAFLRINYAPPLQGGMIDLEYYGVSKYEIADHPDPSLEALHEFFRRLEFDVHISASRVHARYDKEQAPDLRTLCAKAEVMFCLAPYLLDIDWTIGALDLNAEARRKVGLAWAKSFEAWGVLPMRYLLTDDRQGIVESVRIAPTGREVTVWSGLDPYTDRFSTWPEDFFSRFAALGEDLHLESVPIVPTDMRSVNGQLQLERALLAPLRQAVAKGTLIHNPDGYRVPPSDLFHRESEAETFAEIVGSDDGRFEAAAALASLVGPFERALPFRTTGSVGGCEVQSARLPLKGHELGLYVLRDENGTSRLAFYTDGMWLFRRRVLASHPWSLNARFDAGEFLSIIRRANYPAPAVETLVPISHEECMRIRASLGETPRVRPRAPISGERTAVGVRASPGGLAGRVVLGTEGRAPRDLRGAILVSPTLRPEDAQFLYHAAGVVTTGGSILSHAGLLAVQFRKPAIIIAGRWEMNSPGAPALRFADLHYDIEEKQVQGLHVCIRRRMRESEHLLREGDLVVLEAGENILRVLGQKGDVLAFHEAMRELDLATSNLAATTGERDILRLRGDRIRARHHIEKILQRIDDPSLVCHAASELLCGTGLSPAETHRLLGMLLRNPSADKTAQQHLDWKAEKLHELWRAAARTALQRIPNSESLYEILALRLDVLHAHQTLLAARAALGPGAHEYAPGLDCEEPVRARLAALQNTTYQRIEALERDASQSISPHVLRQAERLDRLIGPHSATQATIAQLRSRLARSDADARTKLANRFVVWPEDGGLELFEQVGWKAANLAEISQISGHILVPRWFAVADRAFQCALRSPIEKDLGAPSGTSTLMEAIQAALENERLDHQHRSALIRRYWEVVVLPEELLRDVAAAYRRLGEEPSVEDSLTSAGVGPTVALRSSSHEEDAEFATQAGEFDTFLFIRGEDAVINYLRRTWAGLWSERALHHRSVLGTEPRITGGGVIVQRIVASRVSGVAQTVNLAQNDYRQIVINAGLGLGEGIVSGTVAADLIVVAKNEHQRKGPLQFRYTTAEKKEYVTFDRRAGQGTNLCDAPFHQRRRPALEYPELCELVHVATELESAYGYPLDIEFAIEGTRLWILQARPVPASMASFQETIEMYPLVKSALPSSHAQGDHHHDQARRVS